MLAAPAPREIASQVGQNRHAGGGKMSGQPFVIAREKPRIQEAAGRETGQLTVRVGLERLRLQGGGHVLSGRFRLGGSEGARLERECGRMSGRPYALQTADPAMLIDVDEAVAINRDAGDRTAAQRGKRKDAGDPLDAPARGVQYDRFRITALDVDPGSGEAPTCCMALTVADATPESAALTPRVAVFMDGAMVRPRPMPVKMRPGSMSAA
jgi:hypothetical protein